MNEQSFLIGQWWCRLHGMYSSVHGPGWCPECRKAQKAKRERVS